MKSHYSALNASPSTTILDLGSLNRGGDNWSQIILVPVELDETNHVFGYYFLNNQKFPTDGQKNLVELSGSPIKVELANLNVFTGPILPKLQINYISSLFNLAESIDQCDRSHHSHDTGMWVERIAKRIGNPDLDVFKLGVAGRLHDIGKSVVSKDMLIKPGPLNEKEWKIMHQHPEFSVALMEPAIALETILPIVKWHHEWFNGDGYPDGIKGEEIPIGARILSVVDAYTTMTNGRAYRSPITKEDALQEIQKYSGRQFDPEIVDIMVDLVLFEY
ncbi:MAG: hypothetical protein C0391_04795 [Anaerolinea sp.]|nr:hypothetical protein [Anaerolinea sp.]